MTLRTSELSTDVDERARPKDANFARGEGRDPAACTAPQHDALHLSTHNFRKRTARASLTWTGESSST